MRLRVLRETSTVRREESALTVFRHEVRHRRGGGRYRNVHLFIWHLSHHGSRCVPWSPVWRRVLGVRWYFVTHRTPLDRNRPGPNAAGSGEPSNTTPSERMVPCSNRTGSIARPDSDQAKDLSADPAILKRQWRPTVEGNCPTLLSYRNPLGRLDGVHRVEGPFLGHDVFLGTIQSLPPWFSTSCFP